MDGVLVDGRGFYLLNVRKPEPVLLVPVVVELFILEDTARCACWL